MGFDNDPNHPAAIQRLKNGPLVKFLELILMCDFDIRIKSIHMNGDKCEGTEARRGILQHHIDKLKAEAE